MTDRDKLREWAREHATKVMEVATPHVTGNFAKDCEAWPSQGLDVEEFITFIERAGESLVRRCAEIARKQCPDDPPCDACLERSDAILREFGLEGK